jgi:hypothetical protein
MWRENEQVRSEGEAGSLIEKFTKREIKEALDEMKVTSAPAPDVLLVSFYKTLREQIKAPVTEMFLKFHEGDFNLSRLKYDLISLIPKNESRK